MRTAFSTLLLLLAVPPVHGQSRPDCPMQPPTLLQMRSCYRPLLVFSPTGSDPRLITQRDTLDQAADDMMDRNVLFIPIPERGAGLKPPLDAPFMVFSKAEMGAARKRFGVAPGSFTVVLLGEDGEVKLHSSAPVPVERLSSLIDSMPTRKLEMQRPHAN